MVTRAPLPELTTLVLGALAARGGSASSEEIRADIDSYLPGVVSESGVPLKIDRISNAISQTLAKRKCVRDAVTGRWTQSPATPVPTEASLSAVKHTTMRRIGHAVTVPAAPLVQASRATPPPRETSTPPQRATRSAKSPSPSPSPVAPRSQQQTSSSPRALYDGMCCDVCVCVLFFWTCLL